MIVRSVTTHYVITQFWKGEASSSEMRLGSRDFNALMPRGNKKSHKVNKQVCLSTYDLLLPPGIKGLRDIKDRWR